MPLRDLVRDSLLGQFTRAIVIGRVLFPYPDELNHTSFQSSFDRNSEDVSQAEYDTSPHEKKPEELQQDTEKQSILYAQTVSHSKQEKARQESQAVGWFASEDPGNPHNWSVQKKTFVAFQICLYTFVVYLGSSMSFGSIPIIQIEYDVSEIVASLTIALYVFGYGSGALLFSPLSEVAALGRNIPYLTSLALFLVFSTVTAESHSFGLLLFARFMQGFMGSPALATGAASFQDIFAVQYLPFAFAGWMGAATFGPACGPLISIYSVLDKNWRWPYWEMLWLGSALFVLMFMSLPETSAAKVLYDRRRRLRLEYDRPTVSWLSFTNSVSSTLYTPTKIMLTHPGVCFANIYTCLIYGIYYTYFNSFPLVYINVYHFDYQSLGLSFLSVTVGTIIGIAAFLPWSFWWARSAQTTSPHERPERCLVPAVFASLLLPSGLLLFAWSSKPSIHWAVSLSGIVLFTIGTIVILQCLANYLILIYPFHAASLFAGNDFMRACLATGAVVFSHPLYENLSVAKGVSILAASTALCIGGMVALYVFGEELRSRAAVETGLTTSMPPPLTAVDNTANAELQVRLQRSSMLNEDF